MPVKKSDYAEESSLHAIKIMEIDVVMGVYLSRLVIYPWDWEI